MGKVVVQTSYLLFSELGLPHRALAPAEDVVREEVHLTQYFKFLKFEIFEKDEFVFEEPGRN